MKIVLLVSLIVLYIPAHAVRIVYEGNVNPAARGEWEVTTITGTFEQEQSTLLNQVWFGSVLALEFAELVGEQLGFPNPGGFNPAGNAGPIFAWSYGEGVGGRAVFENDPSVAVNIGVSANQPWTWAVARRVLGPEPETPSHVPSVWTGKPIPEQLPHSPHTFPVGVSKIVTALWFNDSIDEATLTVDDRFNQTSSPRLHCAAAGLEGPQVWQDSGTFTQTPRGKQWRFGRDELLDNGSLELCGLAINTIASLRAAAQQRLIYLEYDRDGARHRAQLWAKELLPLEVEVFPSLDQTVDPQIPDSSKNKTRVLFKATETRSTLNEIHYMFADRLIYSQVERLELFCAAAGQAGVPIAELTARSSESYTALRQSDLRPASADGPCGVEVNNIASLVEAWLQGRLYVHVQKTSGKVLRGQVPHP